MYETCSDVQSSFVVREALETSATSPKRREAGERHKKDGDLRGEVCQHQGIGPSGQPLIQITD